MTAPATNSLSVLHPQYHSVRELCICDETQTSQAAAAFGFGVAPVSASARVTFTQTYSTGRTTVDVLTYVAPAADGSSDMATTAATQTTPWGFASQAQADAIATQFNLLRAQVAAIRTALLAAGVDILSMKKNDTSVIDVLQQFGWAL